MKRVLVIIVTLCALIAVTLGYRNINQKIPPTKPIWAEMGEKIEFQKEIYISVINSELLSEKEAKKIEEDIRGTSHQRIRYLKVDLLLENQSDEKKEVILTDLNMESLGMANGISPEETSALTEQGTIRPMVEAMSEKEVTVVYQIYPNFTTKKGWEQLDDREFWLTFTQYPEKKMLKLK